MKYILMALFIGLFCNSNLIMAQQEADKGTTQEVQEEDPLAALAELGDSLTMEGPEAGGSIRAKKDADLSAISNRKSKKNLQAKVIKITTKQFPFFALKAKVIKPPKEGKYKTVIKKNENIVLIPEFTLKNSKPDLEDFDTLTNAGAYFLRKGDKIVAQLKEKKGNVWIVHYIERK